MTITISPGRALYAQLLLLRSTGRVRILLVTGVLMLLFMTVFFRGAARAVFAEGGVMMLSLQPLLVLTGAAWGIAVWWREPPERRDYLLMLPVDVTHHEVARILAGALWLTFLIGCTMIAAVLLQSAAGFANTLGDAALSAWIAPFSGPLLAYVLTVTIATAARRSIEVALLAIVLLGTAYGVLLRQLITHSPTTMIDTVFRLNLLTALGGFISGTTTNTTYASDGRVLERQEVVYSASMMPQWEFATVLWWTIALCLLVFVLWRRRRA